MEDVEKMEVPVNDNQRMFNKEIQLKNGEQISLPTIHFNVMPLFHGSPKADIIAFDLNRSEQMTIGSGTYFTPDKESATAYAKWRSNNVSNPTLYEVEVRNADIADLRTREAQEKFAKLYKQALLDWEHNNLPRMKGPTEDVTNLLKMLRKEQVGDLVNKIDSNTWSMLRDLTFGWETLVSGTLSENGYKGLMAIEGEPPNVAMHDSIVIFDPQDAPIVHHQAA